MAQVIKKRTIVLASVLKPVTDTRMYEKLGASIASLPNASVHLIGFPASGLANTSPFIQLHAHARRPFGRLSLRRIIAPYKILKMVLRIKPHLLIITTHELLWVAVVCKLALRCKVGYDVQENYFYNILYTNSFHPVLRPVLAVYVRLKELLCRPFVDLFILAEKIYQSELRFAKQGVVLENKLPELLAGRYKRKPSESYTKLVFSGTLSETTGVLEAINLTVKLHALNPEISLTVIGNCLAGNFLETLKKKVAGIPFIRFKGAIYPVGHEDILKEVGNADAGIIIYPPNPSTRGSIPTKLYEYLALQLPVIISHNNVSHQLVNRLNAGIVITPLVGPHAILAWLEQRVTLMPYPDIYWESAEKELLERVSKILP